MTISRYRTPSKLAKILVFCAFISGVYSGIYGGDPEGSPPLSITINKGKENALRYSVFCTYHKDEYQRIHTDTIVVLTYSLAIWRDKKNRIHMQVSSVNLPILKNGKRKNLPIADALDKLKDIEKVDFILYWNSPSRKMRLDNHTKEKVSKAEWSGDFKFENNVFPLLFPALPGNFKAQKGFSWGESREEDNLNSFKSHPEISAWVVSNIVSDSPTNSIIAIQGYTKDFGLTTAVEGGKATKQDTIRSRFSDRRQILHYSFSRHKIQYATHVHRYEKSVRSGGAGGKIESSSKISRSWTIREIEGGKMSGTKPPVDETDD